MLCFLLRLGFLFGAVVAGGDDFAELGVLNRRFRGPLSFADCVSGDCPLLLVLLCFLPLASGSGLVLSFPCPVPPLCFPGLLFLAPTGLCCFCLRGCVLFLLASVSVGCVFLSLLLLLCFVCFLPLRGFLFWLVLLPSCVFRGGLFLCVIYSVKF